MVSKRFWATTLAGVVGWSVVAAVAPDDLNIESAKARYDAQRAVADRAKARHADYVPVFRAAEGRALTALGKLRDAEGRVTTAQREVSRIESAQHSTESEITRYGATQTSLRDQERRLERDVADLQRDRDTAERDMQRADQAHRQAERELDAEKRKPTPDPARVRTLEQRVSQASSELRTKQALVTRKNNDLRDANDDLRKKRDEIATNDRRLDQLRLDLARLGRERDTARDRLFDARSDAERARSDSTFADQQLQSSRTELALRESDWRREERTADELNAEYQQVLANYHRERDRAIRAGDEAGRADGGREGSERGAPAGTMAGSAEARRLGSETGKAQGRARDRAIGYREGRQGAVANTTLAPAYNGGLEVGVGVAAQKARQESFPRGYTAALTEHFAVPPSRTAVVDGAGEAPAPVPFGPWIDTTLPQVLPVAGPNYPMPDVPGGAAPQAPQANPSAPEVDKRYFAPRCTGFPRPEFGPLCEERYGKTYGEGASSAYGLAFSDTFRRAFNGDIANAHAAAFALTHPEQLSAGRLEGARDQGIVDGFAEAFPRLSGEQEQAGRVRFGELQKEGVFVRTVGSEIPSQEDFLVGGKAATVRLRVDNYGGKDVPAGGMRVRTKRAEAVKPTEERRTLPTLPGETGSTVENALTLAVGRVPSGTKVLWEGALERDNGLEVGAFRAEAVVGYPLEIVAIESAAAPAIGKKGEVTVRVKSRRKIATNETKLVLKSDDGSVGFDTEPVTVPALEAGQTTTVTTNATPTAWAGGKLPVPFAGEFAEGENSWTQPVPLVFPVTRSASLFLLGSDGKPTSVRRFTVRAGGLFALNMQLSNETTQFRPGPFGIRAVSTSDTALTNATNTTTGVTYGGLSPGTQWGAQQFVYVVPQSLAGKTAWIRVGVFEGSEWIHLIQVELDVR